MSVKVGQTQMATASTPTRLVGGPAVASIQREIAGLSGSNGVGPEEQSLRFSETWDDLHQQAPTARRRQRSLLQGMRFGSLLTTYEVGNLLMSYRTQHDIGAIPPIRLGTMLYESAMRAVLNGGVVNPLGTQLSRVL